MTGIHLKKKDVVKSSVKGISIEFDHERLAAILDVPGRTGICEYIKEVWEESRYTKPLEITRRFANDATIMKAEEIMSCLYGDWLTLVFEAFGVPLVIKKGEEPKKYDFFEDTFLTMCNRLGKMEYVIDEATVEGESGSGEKFYDAEEEAQGSPELPEEIPADATPSSAQQKDKGIAGVDPSGPTSREADFLKFQAEFERKRANKFHDELEKAKAENAKLLALLHKTQTKPHP
ncbi:hypothetical protein Dimus_008042 [Dionaea muscipula]